MQSLPQLRRLRISANVMCTGKKYNEGQNMLNIVLYEPEIPYNTGNIGRTCVAADAKLHLIRPLGFSLEQKEIHRAGLDYWPKLKLAVYDSFDDFLEKNHLSSGSSAGAGDGDAGNRQEEGRTENAAGRLFLATTKAHQVYTDVHYEMNDFIMFGPESRGIPEEILVDREEDCIRIPMYEDTRSLNLCNSAAIVLYEALRQNDFDGLRKNGELHHLQWRDGRNPSESRSDG